METLADEIARQSAGRVTYDPHRRRLRRLLPDGGHVDHTATEPELRRLLQRLVFASPRRPSPDTDTQALAVELLLEMLEAGANAAA